MSSLQCPVCTLFLREGMSMKDHLDTHTKDRVIEALVSSEKKASTLASQSTQYSTYIHQPPFQLNNPVLPPMQQYSVPIFNPVQGNLANFEQLQPSAGVLVQDNRRFIVQHGPHPGTLVKFPARQPNAKIFTAVPAAFCNQFISTPQFIPSQMQMPARGTASEILSSGNSTQNVNLQVAPTIVNCYSQIPSSIHPTQPGQTFTQQFNTGTNIQETPESLHASSSVLNTSVNTSSQVSIQEFTHSTSQEVESVEVSTLDVVQKVNSNTSLTLTEETCNASTQVCSIEPSVVNDEIDFELDNTDNQFDTCDDEFERIKEELNNRSDEYEIFEETENFETHESVPENCEETDTNYHYEISDKHAQTSDEPKDENIVSEQKKSKNLSENIYKSKEEPTELRNDCEESIDDSEESLLAKERSYGGSNFSIDDSSNMAINDLSDCDYNENDLEDDTFLTSDDAVSYASKSYSSVPLDEENNDEIGNGEDGVFLEREEKYETQLQDDITANEVRNINSRQPIQNEIISESSDLITLSPRISNSNDKNEKHKIIPLSFRSQCSEKSFTRNEGAISIQEVSQTCSKISMTNRKELDIKRKLKGLEIEEPSVKKQKHISPNLELDIKPIIKPTFEIEGNTAYEIKEILLQISSFQKKNLDVHRLSIPEIKNEDFIAGIKIESNALPIKDISHSASKNNLFTEVKIEPLPDKSYRSNITEAAKVTKSKIQLPNTNDVDIIEIDKRNPSTSSLPNLTPSTSFKDKRISVKLKAATKKPTNNSFPYKSVSQKQNFPLRQNSVLLSNEKSELSPFTATVIQRPIKSEPPPPYSATVSSQSIPPLYPHSHLCQAGSSKTNCNCSIIGRSNQNQIQNDFPGVNLSSNKNVNDPSVECKYNPPHTANQSYSKDFSNLSVPPKVDRSSHLPNVDYDSDDAAPHWLFRGLNVLPPVIEDDRISCASPKTLLNLDHQTSFQTFEPDDSGSTSINMQTDEMMPPRGELSGQESLESSAWGYQEENGSSNFRQWEESEQDGDCISNSNNFKTKIEKVEIIPKLGPIQLQNEKIKPEDFDATFSTTTIEPKKKHACIYCNKTFAGWKLRKYHMKTEHADLFNETEPSKLLENVQTSCSALISEPSKLRENGQTACSAMILEPSSSAVLCASTPIKFDTSISFGVHFQDDHVPIIDPIYSKSKQRQCSTCFESFDKLKLYQDHIRYVHPLECPICKKKFLTKPNLTIHMRTHLKIKPYKCDKCEKSFVTAQKLSDHKNTHTGNAPFPCNLCERNFKRYSNLAQHKKVIHMKKKKTKDFYCHCGEIFQSKGKLLWHQETHASVPKQCSFCVEKFTHTSSLTRHIRKNHDPCYLPDDRKKDDENVCCKICKIVVLKSTLKSHMRIHATSKPFSCTVCKKSFYTKWNLGLHQWTHVSRTHMPFKCKSCNRGFYNSIEYQAHLRSHKNIRPYTCNYCGRKFIRKFNCIRHVREHEANKKYTCTICGKTFHRSYYLTAHERVHNGERPFTCHICGKTSTTKSNHNKHVKTHHARETVNTEG